MRLRRRAIGHKARFAGVETWTLVIGNDEVVQVLNASEARLVTDRAPPAANSAAGR